MLALIRMLHKPLLLTKQKLSPPKARRMHRILMDTSISNLSDLRALYEIQPFLSPVRYTRSSRKDRRGELQ